MTIEISKTEKEILRDIALNGEKTIYDISVKDKVAARSTVSDALDKFEKLGLVEVKREEPFSKIKENIKRYYGLTFRGLIEALKLQGVGLNRIAKRKELVSSWMKKARKAESIIRVGDKFRLFKGSEDQRFERIESVLLASIEKGDEDLEKFFKHFDLEFSDNSFVFQELIWEITLGSLAGKVPYNREERRRLEKAFRLKEGVKP